MLDKIAALDVDTPILYVGSDVTTEQKAHNLEVLSALAPSQNQMYLYDKTVNLTGQILLLDSLPITVFQVVYSGSAYTVWFRFSFSLFDLMHYSSSFTTADGSIDANDFSNREFLTMRKATFTLGNENVETTQSETAGGLYPTLFQAIDIGEMFFAYQGSLSYGYNYDYEGGSGYYEVFFDKSDRKIRLRIYGDNHITTLWTSTDIDNMIIDGGVAPSAS